MNRLLLVALVLAACGEEPRRPSGLLPKIDSFIATPMTTTIGEEVVLSWRTTNVVAVDIGPDVAMNANPNGSITVRPQFYMQYTLVAKGDGALTMASLLVDVRPPTLPIVHYFFADPPRITRGSTSALSWAVTDAPYVYVMDDQGNQIYFGSDVEFSVIVEPQPVEPNTVAFYHLFAMDDFGQVAEQHVEIEVLE